MRDLHRWGLSASQGSANSTLHFPITLHKMAYTVQGFTGCHIGFIIATTWVLMLNGAVGYQLIDDGTPLSMIIIAVSSAILFIGTGYIALDTGYGWSGYWNAPVVQNNPGPNQQHALYTLYFLVPLVFLFIFFVLETILVITVLGEVKPMSKSCSMILQSRESPNHDLVWLASAVLFFAIGQVFDFVISPHICNGTNGKIDGSLFETLFTLCAVVMIWVFWSSITEDDWSVPEGEGTSY